mmetsp:Transcript_97008/g.250911  ORF Transcript_97008/g.250911 Transcript_97008/m.250911 type:complete len:187 (+) Transcript_97008:90-650(+)
MARMGSIRRVAAAAALLLLPAIAAAGPCGEPTGTFGVLVSMGEACFEACPQMCGAAESAVGVFSASGPGEALNAAICATKAEFMCAVTGQGAMACASLLDQAGSLNFDVPRTPAAFNAMCRAGADGAQDVLVNATTTMVATTTTDPNATTTTVTMSVVSAGVQLRRASVAAAAGVVAVAALFGQAA